jgi:hypothetical protein
MTSRYKKNKKHLKDPYAFDTTDDDSDDEDEELFRPQLDLSQKSTRTTSTTDSTNTIEPTAAASTSTAAAPVVCTTAVSPETIETQGAFDFMRVTTNVQRLCFEKRPLDSTGGILVSVSSSLY